MFLIGKKAIIVYLIGVRSQTITFLVNNSTKSGMTERVSQIPQPAVQACHPDVDLDPFTSLKVIPGILVLAAQVVVRLDERAICHPIPWRIRLPVIEAIKSPLLPVSSPLLSYVM